MIDVQPVIDIAQAAADPVLLTPGSVYSVIVGGRLETIDLTGDQYRDLPKRKTGTVLVRDVNSFAEYWGKHSDSDSEVFADRESRTVTAVLDANTGTGARWQQHRLKLGLQYSQAWQAWTAFDGRPLDQEAFAEFLEDNRADIHDPPAADMLEIASSLQASTKAEFQSGIVLANGQRKLSYVEQTTAQAGQRGDLTIPTEITLGLAVFEGSAVADAVTARFRYRISNGKLSLHYKLDRPADVISTAFAGVVAEVERLCSATVLRGNP